MGWSLVRDVVVSNGTRRIHLAKAVGEMSFNPQSARKSQNRSIVEWEDGKLANMKATIEIPDELYREAKIAAAMQGTKIKDLVAEGLRRVLREGYQSEPRRRIPFPLIREGEPASLNIPDDAAHQIDIVEDEERHALSV